ncbi:MAG: class E sortase [Actinomycetota bacterium]|nr:class E sortase [Actinomycetota bacterium]
MVAPLIGSPGSGEVRRVVTEDGQTRLVPVVPSQQEPAVIRRLRELRRNGGDDVQVASGDDPVAGASGRLRRLFVNDKRKGGPIGRIQIPAIDVNERYRRGVYDEPLQKGPGHWPGTPLPGARGNSVLSGHRTTYTQPFADLDLLERGDRVVTTLGGKHRTAYRVTKTTVVPESNYVKFVLRQPQARRARMITMFACTPKGYRTHRIVVQAKALPSDLDAVDPGGARG